MRRTKEEAEQTRQDLLNAALKVFGKKGYQATRLDDISEEAGVTRGAISWHFKNKQTIFRTLVLDSLAETKHVMERHFEKDQDPASRIKNFISHMLLDHYRRKQEMLVLIRLQLEQLDEMNDVSREIKGLEQMIIPTLAKAIREGQTEGLFDPDNSSDFIAKSIYTFFWGFFANYKSLFANHPSYELGQSIDQLLNQFLGIAQEKEITQ